MNSISTSDLQAKLASDKEVNIIDVREVGEYMSGKIPGSINIPLGLLEFRMNELDKSKEYYIVCLSGGRSYQATRFLDYNGYKATNVMGGMMSWGGEID